MYAALLSIFGFLDSKKVKFKIHNMFNNAKNVPGQEHGCAGGPEPPEFPPSTVNFSVIGLFPHICREGQSHSFFCGLYPSPLGHF